MNAGMLLSTFTDNLMPIILLGGLGFLAGKFLSVDSRTVGRIVFYLFSPILVFDLLLNSELDPRQTFTAIGLTAALIASLCVLSFLLGKVIKLERPLLLAVMLTASFGNTGNYGLPLVAFAFGEQALAYATLFFVTTTVLFNTLGVLIASLGRMDLKPALLGLFKVPAIYAVALAVLLNGLGAALPTPLVRAVDLAADGSIPLMLVLLGLELTRVQWSHNWRALGLGVFLRLIVSPIIGILLVTAFGIQGAARNGTVVQSSMPAAVSTTVLAAEYRLEPSLVTSIVFLGTLLSPLTLTLLLVFLGR